MPGGGNSDSDSDNNDYKKQDEQEKTVSRQSSRQQSAGGRPDDDDSPQWGTSGEAPRQGGGNEPPMPENEQWSSKLNILMLVTLGLSWLLLIIITATQSWGVGKVLEQDTPGSGQGITAGLWEVCDSVTCYSWSDWCSEGEGNVTATGGCCIVTIIWLTVMLVVQVLIKVKGSKDPSELTPKLPKVQCCLGHVLWFLLMLDWVFWAANHNAISACALGSWNAVLYYAWGWMFVLWMWLVHLLTAILVTMKVKGKPLPCAM